MGIFCDWKFYVIIYILLSALFNQSYKKTTNNMKNPGALTILIQLIAASFCIFLIPFFELKFPKDYKTYIFLLLAIIFYTLNNRLSTTSRSGVDASIYSVIKQLANVFMIFFGILIFKEKFMLNKFLGSFLIISSNVLVLYKKGKFVFNKYVLFGVIANVCMAIGMMIDVNYSLEFNLPIYVLAILIIPSIIIFLIERIKIKDIINEYKKNNRFNIFITSFLWCFMFILKIKAYQLGNITLVAPLTSLSVMLTVLFSYLFLGEKDNLKNKIIAGIMILIGIFLINI